MSPPARYLLIIEGGGETVARLFDAERRHLADVDASSEEVAVMTAGLQPQRGVAAAEWGHALDGHNPGEQRDARVYTLDV
jgi:hypothetical protein